ncbi:MAG: hypothetical protein ACRELG_06820 [Gemmataceae bacterium]
MRACSLWVTLGWIVFCTSAWTQDKKAVIEKPEKGVLIKKKDGVATELYLTTKKPGKEVLSSLKKYDLKGLKTLSLSGTDITDKGFDLLLQATKHPNGTSGIKSLNLNSNPNITAASIKKLGALKGLESVNLSGMKIGAGGFRELRHLISVKDLNLSNTDITDKILLALRKDGTLARYESINLALTAISDDGLPALTGLTKLKSLLLTRTNVTDDGMKHLVGLDALQSLALNRTRVTPKGVAVVNKNLPHCKVKR